MKQIPRVLVPLTRDARGVALPLALMALLVLAAMSGALLTIGVSEVQISANLLRGTQAQFLAEAGLEDAFNWFRSDDNRVINAPTPGPTTISGLSGPGTTLSAVGTYSVQYMPGNSTGSTLTNSVLVVSTGTITSGSITIAQKVIRAIISNGYNSNDAVRTKGNLTIDGSVEIEGTCGNVHTNGNLTLSGGGIDIDQSATASGTYTTSGSPNVGGTAAGSQPTKDIPTVDPAYFLDAAKKALAANTIFQMKSDGKVLDGAGTLLTTLTSGQTYNYFTYTSGTPASWSLSGNTGSTGTYYFEGNVSISGGPGSSSTPWTVTVIATGDITVSGNPTVTPHLKDTLFVAGLDLKISGNVKNDCSTCSAGVIAAHEQLDIAGSTNIKGYVIAEDAASTSGTVAANKIHGSVEIVYNCGLAPPIPGPLQIIAWGT